MRIDRSAFLTLTAVLASAGACARQDPPRAAEGAKPAPTTGEGLLIPKLATPDSGVVEEPRAVAEPPKSVCPENAVGSDAACQSWRVDPTCESSGPAAAECMMLFYGSGERASADDGFQPRVAEKAAQCMTAKPITRASGCRRPDMHKCIRDAVDTVCVDPAMTAACEKIVAGCTGRGQKLSFTVEQCAKIATSTRGSMREWALEAMSGLSPSGTPMREGCSLSYVTIYQPWPKNWWSK